MAAFFAEVLDDFLSPAFLEGVRRKFHYGEAQAADLRMVAQEMLPLMRREAFWERGELSGGWPYAAENPDAGYEAVAMSLGGGVDCLQEGFGQRGRLSLSYMAETLAGEILLKGYEAYNRYVRENTQWHVARYHFPGSEEAFPLAMLPELLEGLTEKVTCNAAFCMLPKKSVAFVSELTKDEKVRCRGVCAGCNSARCPNRAEAVLTQSQNMIYLEQLNM